MSGLTVGKTIVSCKIYFTSAKPFTSSHFTFGEESRIVSSIDLTIAGSRFPNFLSSFFSSDAAALLA